MGRDSGLHCDPRRDYRTRFPPEQPAASRFAEGDDGRRHRTLRRPLPWLGQPDVAWGSVPRCHLGTLCPDGGRRKTLYVGVSYPNRCNLRSNRDAEKRRLGRTLLEGWGILRTSRGMSRRRVSPLPKLLDLYDLNVETMTEGELAARGFDVQQLIDLRLAEPRGRLTHMLIEEDDGPELVEVCEGLAGTAEYTDATGRQAWAPGALIRKIGVNTSYLTELILREIEGLLSRRRSAA